VSGSGGWQEVGDRVYRRRYESLDLNVGAVVGADEVLVVDTRSFAAEAAQLRRGGGPGGAVPRADRPPGPGPGRG
jgi:hypothetical protein